MTPNPDKRELNPKSEYRNSDFVFRYSDFNFEINTEAYVTSTIDCRCCGTKRLRTVYSASYKMGGGTKAQGVACIKGRAFKQNPE